jgi:hypothetical protein
VDQADWLSRVNAIVHSSAYRRHTIRHDLKSLRDHHSPADTQKARRRRAVSDEASAKAHIAGVVESRGSLPHQWIWYPFAAFGKDDWVPVRLTPLEAKWGCTRFQFEKWEIVRSRSEWRVKQYGNFFRSDWPTLESAKQFCHEQDGRLTPTERAGATLH